MKETFLSDVNQKEINKYKIFRRMESVKWNRLFFDISIDPLILYRYGILHYITKRSKEWKNIAFFVVIPSSFWPIKYLILAFGIFLVYIR